MAVVVDACTLNNALNVTQLAILVALLHWVRSTSTRTTGEQPRAGSASPERDDV